MIGSLIALALALTPQQSAEAQVARAYERVGRTAPRVDPILTEAAKRIATYALNHSAEESSSLLRLSREVSSAGGWDPAPRAIVIRSTPADYALEKFLQRTDLADDPASHVGIGLAANGERGALVALFSERKARLREFSRLNSVPGTRTLCGELEAPLKSAELFVTHPDGAVEKIPPRGGPEAFCADVRFPTAGRYAVEVVGRGPGGPEVAALIHVDVGAVSSDASEGQFLEPSELEPARVAVLARVNALRKAQQEGSLALEPKLNEVAQAYAEQMAKEHFFAHVSPDGTDVRTRLARAGFRYLRAGENLAYAPGPLSAEFAIEQSPGHRGNLLEGDFTSIGIGVALDRSHETPQVLLVEVFARPLLVSATPLEDAYRALASRRAQFHLPRLERSETLEQIAFARARRALNEQRPPSEDPGLSLRDQVFTAFPQAKLATADFFVADQPTAVPESKGLRDPRIDHVGIGAVRGDSTRFGKDQYWVVVIYTASTN